MRTPLLQLLRKSSTDNKTAVRSHCLRTGSVQSTSYGVVKKSTSYVPTEVQLITNNNSHVGTEHAYSNVASGSQGMNPSIPGAGIATTSRQQARPVLHRQIHSPTSGNLAQPQHLGNRRTGLA
jgi:hypothetical protein